MLGLPHDGGYERKTASDGSPYFVLKASNGQVIGKSEMYSSSGATALDATSYLRCAGSGATASYVASYQLGFRWRS